MWKFIYKYMVIEKEEEISLVDGECDDEIVNF